MTNQLPSNLVKGSGTSLSPLLFGNWQDLIYAFWSGQDVIVDPYTGSSCRHAPDRHASGRGRERAALPVVRYGA